MNIALRPARPADAEEMTRWFADEADIAQWAGPETDFPLSEAHLRTWMAEPSAGRPPTRFSAVDGGDTPVGYFQLVHDGRNRTVRIARFGVAPSQRGKGFGTALFAIALDKAFGEMNAHRVDLGVWSTNVRARRLYEGAGFRHEGTARENSRVAGKWYSTDTMSLLRTDRARQASPTAAVA